ncbi:hypothetical protein SAMN05660649_02295 [Desulfotomaculum arcticum]|uniref:Uncharacterized protein n=1 Tax=Desulfotruncus arcticus DSM 17038 TaxID=1121424 RepID=A0A1I2TJG4_9FIRM|nr:hypothetical protein [Desulfotruncus arcticus]SFG65028.1 hypothetical protein SAMN05660649_02295 [Desulfotomaculum arcticum] [Desulfotruncus arcticus DSM 17038]
MPTGNKFHNWMVHNLEEPFYKAELHRADMVQDRNNHNSGKPKLIVLSLVTLIPVILLVAGSL